MHGRSYKINLFFDKENFVYSLGVMEDVDCEIVVR